jgi:hypothetical protein
MHKLSIFPTGRADCCRIDLHNGKKLLLDYAHPASNDQPGDCRIDLARTLRKDLYECHRNGYDVVAFTRLDDDHTRGATEFFWFDHSLRCQGQGRIKMGVLWVPGAALTETGLTGDARTIQVEAHCRFRRKSGIRVFSQPEHLRVWVEEQGMDFSAYRHLLSAAGQLAPEFTLDGDGIEFLVQSELNESVDESMPIGQHDSSLIMQATFAHGGRKDRITIGALTPHDAWEKIIRVTGSHGNQTPAL